MRCARSTSRRPGPTGGAFLRESADWFQLTANPAESEALSRMLDTCDI
ncbi:MULTISPECIES: hypothetical protein [unclassified Streptomyces]